MICIPVMGKTQTAAMKAVEKSAPHCDMIELRMDLIPKADLSALIDRGREISPILKVLVTNRSASQSGKAPPVKEAGNEDSRPSGSTGTVADGEKKRIALLKDAVAVGCDYVDCELDTPETLRRELLSGIEALHHRTGLIVSDHDFKKTPPLAVLKKRFRSCVEAKADIVKIVTYARHPEDNLRILELVAYARKEGLNIAAFCMGPHGTASRILAPLMGSCISYASLRRGLESAPGQLTVNEIKDIFYRLHIKA
ncbi:MAG: type I 3-dehydroquinate dehydratase [Deltaproteobacteria bacterium]|nr:type I 3-dehydroquinate dehydratase [Deltaproteobacteria bacterium]